jgi:hypothetical protein
VVEEALVLGRDEGALHEIGNVAERHRDAPVAGLVQLGEMRPPGVEDARGAREAEPLEPRRIRQVGGGLVVEIDDGGEIDRGRLRRLVLAQLAIGRVEIGEIEPVEFLHLAGRDLRVGERGLDQVVERQALDLEHRAHVLAAGAQEAEHLGAVGRAVEMRLHVVGPGRHLAQGKDDRQDLDENRFHR